MLEFGFDFRANLLFGGLGSYADSDTIVETSIFGSQQNLSVEGSGGLALGGAADFSVTHPAINDSFTGAGGLALGGSHPINEYRQVDQQINLLTNAVWAGAGPPTNWALYNSGGGTAVLGASNINDGTGAQAYQFSIGGAATQMFMYPSVTVQPNTSYTLSFELEDLTGGPTGNDFVSYSALPSGSLVFPICEANPTGTGSGVLNPGELICIFEIGATGGTLTPRIGLGASAPRTNMTGKISRPQISMGDSRGSFVPTTTGPAAGATALVLGGTAEYSVGHSSLNDSFTGAGGMATGGGALETMSLALQSLGGMALAGAALVALALGQSGSGGLVFGGTAPKGVTTAASGGVTAAGSAPVAPSVKGTGGVVTGGAAVSSGVFARNDAFSGAGGVSSGGSALLGPSHIGRGGAVSGGAAPFFHTGTFVGQGGIATGGHPLTDTSPALSGGAQLGGGAVVAATFTATGEGGLALGGAAEITAGIILVVDPRYHADCEYKNFHAYVEFHDRYAVNLRNFSAKTRHRNFSGVADA